MPATYLDRILAHHRERAAADDRHVDDLVELASRLGPTRGFRAALTDRSELAVIAEIKRRSPSKGELNIGLDPAELAATYEAGGAACLSVLTDEEHFGGSVADLEEARDACGLPVIRKDFTVCELDVIDARLMGADAVLLIAAALSDDELQRFHDLAVGIGLDALVEIHDEAELERALTIGATLIGVNQRDLVTFEVDQRASRADGRCDPQRRREGRRIRRARGRRCPSAARRGIRRDPRRGDPRDEWRPRRRHRRPHRLRPVRLTGSVRSGPGPERTAVRSGPGPERTDTNPGGDQ